VGHLRAGAELRDLADQLSVLFRRLIELISGFYS
jgi:hypothetical protein